MDPFFQNRITASQLRLDQILSDMKQSTQASYYSPRPAPTRPTPEDVVVRTDTPLSSSPSSKFASLRSITPHDNTPTTSRVGDAITSIGTSPQELLNLDHVTPITIIPSPSLIGAYMPMGTGDRAETQVENRTNQPHTRHGTGVPISTAHSGSRWALGGRPAYPSATDTTAQRPARREHRNSTPPSQPVQTSIPSPQPESGTARPSTLARPSDFFQQLRKRGQPGRTAPGRFAGLVAQSVQREQALAALRKQARSQPGYEPSVSASSYRPAAPATHHPARTSMPPPLQPSQASTRGSQASTRGSQASTRGSQASTRGSQASTRGSQARPLGLGIPFSRSPVATHPRSSPHLLPVSPPRQIGRRMVPMPRSQSVSVSVERVQEPATRSPGVKQQVSPSPAVEPPATATEPAGKDPEAISLDALDAISPSAMPLQPAQKPNRQQLINQLQGELLRLYPELTAEDAESLLSAVLEEKDPSKRQSMIAALLQ